MASYAIIKSDGTAGPSIPDSASPDAQTDLQLVGQNAISYGLDIAQSFYYLLENFAKDTAPTGGSLGLTEGQLWYDKGGVTLTPGLKVYSGTAWDAMAPTAFGTVNDTTLRYNLATKKWLESTRVRISSDATGVLSVLDATLADSLAISHDGTNVSVVGTGTTNINITGVTAVAMPSATLVTPLAATSGGTGTNTYTAGQILYASGVNTLAKLAVGSNGDVLTLAAGVPSWVAGSAGVSAFNDLSDVTSAGAPTNSLLYKSAGDWIVTTGLSWNGTTLNATQYNGILASNLISRAAPGTISGIATYTANITMAAADITFLDDDQLIFGTGSDVAVDFDGTNFVVAGTGQYNISGFSQVYATVPVEIDNITGEALTLQGNSATTTLDTYLAFRDSAGTLKSYVGIRNLGQNKLMLSGGSDGIYAVGTDALTKIDVGTGVQLYTTSSNIAMGTAVVGSSFKTSRGTIYNNINVGSGGYSIGYNETPNVSDTVLSSTGGTHNVSIDDVGLMMVKAAANVSNTTISFPDITTIAPGSSFLIHNDSNTGSFTIKTVISTNLQWIDGSGATGVTGDRALAPNSICTVRKKSAAVYQIWGNGIS